MTNTTPKPDKVLHGAVYTIEPGCTECAKYLSVLRGGGIGARTVTAKCYDYTSFSWTSPEYDLLPTSDAMWRPHLRNLVSMMNYVDENVRFYCITDRHKVRNYIRDYLDAFLTKAWANEIKQMINDYLTRRNHTESGYNANIVLGTPFYNDLFYSTSWKVAQALFDSSAIDSLLTSFRFIRGHNPKLPDFKTFVNRFDGGETIKFFFDVDDGQCRLDDTWFLISKDFHCSKNEYQKSLAPYILFLSNWTLLLACWLCMHEFGQCAFGLYWESGVLELPQMQQSYEWWRTHRP